MTRGRLAVRILLVVAAVIGAVVVLALVALQTDAGRAQVARLAERQLEAAMNDADVSFGEIRGNVLSSPTVHNLSISRGGTEVLAAERVDIRYDLPRMLGGEIAVDEVTITNPVIRLEQGPDGLTLLDLFAQEDEAPQQTSRAFEIAPIVITGGRVLVGPDVDQIEAVNLPEQIRDLDARLRVAQNDEGFRLFVEALSMQTVGPPLVVEQFTGGIRMEQGNLQFENVTLRTRESSMRLDGRVANLTEPEKSP